METPSRGDGEAAWRLYAAQLRAALQHANRRASAVTVVEVRAREAEARLASAMTRLDRAKKRHKRWSRSFALLVRARNRDAELLTQVEKLLNGGDIPAAIDLLAERRAAINAARARREAFSKGWAVMDA